MKLMLEKEYEKYVKEIEELFPLFQIREEGSSYDKPKFGEVWICRLPVLVMVDEEILFRSIARPVLVVDDTLEHFIKHDKRNYYVLKITSQEDSYQRVKLPNYKRLGLQKESYVRLELPIKVEKDQFVYRIGKLSRKDTLSYIEQLKKIFYSPNTATKSKLF